MALRILIVDDNRDQADILAVMVRFWGHTATVAYDGAAGLKAAREQAPNCVILDINMPEIDGYSLAKMIRREAGLAGVKLMALSAYTDPDHIRRATEAGFDYRLPKTADPSELRRMLTMIDHIIQLAAQTEELARKNVAVAERTETLLKKNETLTGETKALLHEVKEELREVKADVRDIKDEIREVKDRVDKASDGEGWKKSQDD
ncbi:response regulator [Zavarzinella formosa]|uniref:response regulator n=1 Tax=Zavarzinella formosa TaxID=360055 RepID=UPI000367A993|nr:response regulator [Zavarzinella formosa]